MAPRQQLSPAPSESRDPEYTFGRFRLSEDGTLLRGDESIHLAPKELAALRVLLHRAGQVVSRAQLRQELWGDIHVTVESVPRCLSSLRARLEPDQCIQTLYKRGYRMIVPVVQHGPGARAVHRIALMPFSSGKGVDEHLGPVISEEVTSVLTQIDAPGLSIVARDSVFSLARQGRTGAEVGALLHADVVLTGELRAAPSFFRLRVEMVRVFDSTQIWVEDMLVPRERLSTLKDELVVRLLVRLGSDDRSFAGPVLPRFKPDAYESFLRGRHEGQSLERHRMMDGMQNLLLATELDPSLVSAKVDLAHVIVAQELCGYMPPRVAAERIRSMVRGVEDLDASIPALLPSLGWMIFHVDRQADTALEMFSQSAHVPHDSWTTRLRALLALSLHSFDEAAEWLESALILDPYAPGLRAQLAWTRHLAGDSPRAMAELDACLRVFPDHEMTRFYGAMVLAHAGEIARAEAMAEALIRQSPYCDHALANRAYVLARAGRDRESRDLLERLVWLSRERYVSSSFLAAAFVALEETDEALAALQAANEARCPWFFQVLADPRIAALRGNPEFELLRAQTLPQNDGEPLAQLQA